MRKIENNQTLNSPYGGVLVRRFSAPKDDEEINSSNSLIVSEIIESDLWNIATGAFSPLQHFMGERDFLSVCQNMRLDDSKLSWTIPIVLDLSEDEKDRISGKPKVYLISQKAGQPIGFIEPEDIYRHDRDLHLRSVFGTTDKNHPGVNVVTQMKSYLLGGRVHAFEHAFLDQSLPTPIVIRRILEEKGLSRLAGFQTRNVVHRAHEYLQRVALEAVGGILIQPVVGWKKKGDFKPDVIKKTYGHFIESYYPKDRALLAFLNLAMRYAGPKEAVLHAIVRKNFGCSHFIVGRDHAGVGEFYDKYSAHNIFELIDDIGIQILKLREPYYCLKCSTITSDNACNHEENVKEYISGTKIRAILKSGSDPAGQIFRKEVLDILNTIPRENLFYE